MFSEGIDRPLVMPLAAVCSSPQLQIGSPNTLPGMRERPFGLGIYYYGLPEYQQRQAGFPSSDGVYIQSIPRRITRCYLAGIYRSVSLDTWNKTNPAGRILKVRAVDFTAIPAVQWCTLLVARCVRLGSLIATQVLTSR